MLFEAHDSPPLLSVHQRLRLATFLGAGLFIVTLGAVGEGSAKPSSSKLTFAIKKVSAPYPKHCLDQRQWHDPYAFSPYNIFTAKKAWQLCEYAIKDQGYTVHFRLQKPIKIDQLELPRT